MWEVPFNFFIFNGKAYIVYTVCSPPIVRFLSVITYLTSFTPSTSPYPLETTNLLSMFISKSLFKIYMYKYFSVDKKNL